MRKFQNIAIALVLAAAATAAASAQAGDAARPTVDPDALNALRKMGTYLRSLSAFQISVATEDEDVLDDGQKTSYDGTVELLAQRPNHLRVVVSDERKDREFYFDGKTLTLYAKRVGYYASVSAPPTIGELAEKLESDYGTSLPLVDLFRWGTPGYETAGIVAAVDAGPSAVGGVSCEHYLFRQSGLDWQVWIQQGDYPLPRKLVITTTSDEARPQHTAVYTWNLAPAFDDAAFIFDPPAGVAKVALAREE